MAKDAHMIISKEAFESLPQCEQNYTIYLNLNNIERRVYALEHKGWIDKSKSFLGGILGGVLTILGIKYGGLE